MLLNVIYVKHDDIGSGNVNPRQCVFYVVHKALTNVSSLILYRLL